MMSESKVHPASGESSTNTSPEPSGEVPKNKTKGPTYVVKVPKDQIYRVPPPENAHRYDLYTRRGLRRRRSCCCCCLAWVFGIFAVLSIAVAVVTGVVYFAYHPKMPSYSVADVSVYGFNLSSPAFNSKSFQPEFDMTVRVQNPNTKIDIDYLAGNSVKIYYSDVILGRGAWPKFRSERRNVTWAWAALTSPRVRLSDNIKRQITEEQAYGKIPLSLEIKVPAKFKIGKTTSWTVTFDVQCQVNVDRLVKHSKILYNECNVKVDLF